MTQRACGECTLCCTLVPVEEVDKPCNTKCRYQFSKGCRVYHTPRQPFSCVAWTCKWLDGHDTGERPDRAHYCVDPLHDGIRITTEGEEPAVMTTVQVWCDPKYPDAHRDPRLRKWLEGYTFTHQCAVIVRYASDKAFVLFPPWLVGSWREMKSDVRDENDPKTIEDRRALGLPVVNPKTIEKLTEDYRRRNK